jgi:hypothetical protein
MLHHRCRRLEQCLEACRKRAEVAMYDAGHQRQQLWLLSRFSTVCVCARRLKRILAAAYFMPSGLENLLR